MLEHFVNEYGRSNVIYSALSRHSTISLAAFATPPAEKSLGFIRELTVEELQEMQAVREKEPLKVL